MEEIWKFYKETTRGRYGHRIYEVSNYGRVKCNGKLFKCRIGTDGYYYLCHRLLHRIIAELFITGYYENCEIDHKDCNPLNNRVDNLLICQNHKQNMNNPLTRQHIRESSNKKNPITIQHYREGSHKKSILQYTLDNIFVAEYISIQEAERQTNIFHGSILKCCKQKRKSAGDYIWKYK